MTADPASQARRDMIESGQPAAGLAADSGQRWTTAEMTRDFEVIGFAAPFVVVRRRSDGQVGTLEFVHHPRTADIVFTHGHAQRQPRRPPDHAAGRVCPPGPRRRSRRPHQPA